MKKIIAILKEEFKRLWDNICLQTTRHDIYYAPRIAEKEPPEFD